MQQPSLNHLRPFRLVVTHSITLAAACLLSSCEDAAQPQPPTILNISDQPQVMFHDFGPMLLPIGNPSAQLISHTFRIPNPSSDKAIELTVLKSSCACTVANVIDEKVEPGGFGEITMSVSMRSQPKQLRETALIDAGGKKVELALTAYILPRLDVDIHPKGKLRLSPSSTKRIVGTIRAHQLSTEPECPIAVSCNSDVIRVVSHSNSTHRVASEKYRVTSCRVVLELNCPSADDGLPPNYLFRGRFAVKHGSEVIHETFEWYRSNPIVQRPAQAFVHLGGDSALEKVIRLTSSIPFTIKSIENMPDGISVKCDRNQTRKSHEVRITVTPEAVHSTSNRFELRLLTDHPAQPTVVLPIFCLDLK